MVGSTRIQRPRASGARLAAVLSVALGSVLGAEPVPAAPPFMTHGRLSAPARVNHTPNAISARVVADAKAHRLIFISDDSNPGSVLIFERGSLSAPIGSITNGVSVPETVVVDGADNVYVANGGNNTVTKYAPPYRDAPTVYTGFNSLTAAAVSTNGALYALDWFPNFRVVVFPAGSTTSSGTLTSSVNGIPYQLAVDAAGNVYLGAGCPCTNYYSGPSTVVEFKNGMMPATNLNLQKLQGIGGIAFGAKGDLVVGQATDVGFPQVVWVYAPLATEPKRMISSPNFLLPWTIAFDRRETHLYVGNVYNNNVEELDYATGAVLDRYIGLPTQSIGFGIGLSPAAP